MSKKSRPTRKVATQAAWMPIGSQSAPLRRRATASSQPRSASPRSCGSAAPLASGAKSVIVCATPDHACTGPAKLRARRRMRARELAIALDLHLGRGEGRILAADLSVAYVRFNAEYTT